MFDELQVDSVTTDARFLLDRISVWADANGRPVERFRRRDLLQKVRRIVKTTERMKAALRVLVEHGYLRPVAPPPGPGRKPDLYDVNPETHRNCTQNTQNSNSGYSGYAFHDSEVHESAPTRVPDQPAPDEGMADREVF